MQAEAVINHIVNWLSDYREKAGTKGFVIGVSGGVDSALTSTLAAKTGAPTLCLEMPIHQAESQVSRAQKHIKWLEATFPNVSSERVDLTQSYDSFVSLVSPSENESLYQLTLANTRARLRMTTLYYFAGIHSSLVVGTGNKIEDFGVGFFTKYGDGGVDISPIADLVKSEVFTLAKHVGVHEGILSAEPTDGLFGDDRTDEDQLGASYDELEWAMKYNGSAPLTERQKEVIKIYQKLNKQNQHKIQPIPVCLISNDLRS